MYHLETSTVTFQESTNQLGEIYRLPFRFYYTLWVTFSELTGQSFEINKVTLFSNVTLSEYNFWILIEYITDITLSESKGCVTVLVSYFIRSTLLSGN